MDQQVKLKRIFVTRLFGRFDYNIDFTESGRAESGITIITAPNGYGKSTLLRLIDDFFRGNYRQISRTEFSQLVIETSDGRSVMFERQLNADDLGTNRFSLLVRQVLNKWRKQPVDQSPWIIETESLRDNDFNDDVSPRGASFTNIDQIGRELGLRRVGAREWRDPADGCSYTREDLIQLFGEHQTGGLHNRKIEPSWVTEFRAALNILYISANRLRATIGTTSSRRPRASEMVEVISDRVLEQLREFNGRYAGMGRALEQDFPSRVIEAIGSGRKVEHDEIKRLMDEVHQKESDYQELGLLSEERAARRVDLGISDPSALLVLGIYLEDIKKKLNSLQETAERLRIFIGTLNSMLLFKRLELNAEIGFQAIGDNEITIPLRALSSGEQHLIVLLGEIVFESTDGGVVLLDEPEISFHPEWQERFPEVLEKIVVINKAMIIMATHSPTLIQDKWDSVIELADQVNT